MGRDGVPGEAWKYGGEEVERWIWKVCRRVWGGERDGQISGRKEK